MKPIQFDTWKETAKSFQYRNYNISYHDERQAEEQDEVLLCIHGFPTASWDWNLMWPDLIQKYRVIAPDMIGFGFSDKPRNYEYNIQDQAILFESLLDSLDIHSVHILAHDYGDTVAQELLARFEDRKKAGIEGLQIKSICLLNGGLFPETHRALLIQKLLMSPFGFLVSKMSSEKIVRKQLCSVFGKNTQPTEQQWQEFWTLIRFNQGQKISHKLNCYMAERKRYRTRWVGALQNSTIAIRLINGTDDPVSGIHMVTRYNELMSNPDVVQLEGVGHYPQVENSSGVLGAFFQFQTDHFLQHKN